MYTKSDGELNFFKIIVHSILGLVLLTVVLGSFGTIDAGERGVKTRLGKVMGNVEPGLYFKLPIVDHIQSFNIKTQVVSYEREDPLDAASRDLQDVKVATIVNYHLDPSSVGLVYSQFGQPDVFETNVIRPVVRDTVKAIASQYTAEELVTKRPEFTDAVLKKLSERLSDRFVTVEHVNITNFQFSDSFQAAIDAKVTATQNALAAENKLAQVKFEAQQQIETAKATAEAQRISSQALAAQGGEDYVNLKAIEKWDGHLPTQMIPGSSVPFLNLQR